MSLISRISGGIILQRHDLIEPWEQAADTLIRDLPDKIRSMHEIEKADGSTGPDSLSAAYLRLWLAARDVRSITPISTVSLNQEWVDYAIEILKIVRAMAYKAKGKKPSISHREAKAVILIQKALAHCGHNVSAESIVKEFKRKNVRLM